MSKQSKRANHTRAAKAGGRTGRSNSRRGLMAPSKARQRAPVPLVPAEEKEPADLLREHVREAQNHYERAKTGAARSAAHMYIIWHQTDGPAALTQGRDWLDGEIGAINDAVDEHNKHEKWLRDRVDRYKAGTLPSNDPAKATNISAADREAAQKELETLVRLSNAAWNERKKRKIEAREKAIPFARVIKLALQSDPHKSIISRFAVVLEWIDEQPALNRCTDASAIQNAIQNAGGFEAVLNIQRLKRKPKKARAKGQGQGQPDAQSAGAVQPSSFPTAIRYAPQVAELPTGRFKLFAEVREGKLVVLGVGHLTKNELVKISEATKAASEMVKQ